MSMSSTPLTVYKFRMFSDQVIRPSMFTAHSKDHYERVRGENHKI